MKLKMDAAARVLKDYSSLKGNPLDRSRQDVKITDVVIVPAEPAFLSPFLSSYKIKRDSRLSMADSGYTGEDFSVKVISYHGSNVFHFNLDVYCKIWGISFDESLYQSASMNKAS